MQLLSDNQIIEELNKLPEWRLEGISIKKDWSFVDFKEAVRFINKVADLAESNQHHPEILNVYNKVTLSLNTHEAGGITIKDINLAGKLNEL